MGGLFEYAGARRGHDLTRSPLAVIDFETTGLSASKNRVIEMAVARVEHGRVVDEWSSLVNAGCDPGPTFIHKITADQLADAPPLGDVVGAFLERLDGAVVVAHNASFEEQFLVAELNRLRISVPAMPALCTLSLARQTIDAPNYKLGSCCSATGGELVDAHTALGDVRATTALVVAMLDQSPDLRWKVATRSMPRVPSTARPRPRVGTLRRGDEGWMASLLSKLPMSMTPEDLGGAEAYLEAAELALVDGKITGDEAKILASLAAGAGLGPVRVAELNRRILDGLRDVALEDDVLTVKELRDLNRAAKLLAAPNYFADLEPTTTKPDRSGSSASGSPKAQNRGRIWLPPELNSYSERVTAAGYQVGRNITRTLIGVVVHEDHTSNSKVARALEHGVPLIHVDMLDLVLEGHDPLTPPPYSPTTTTDADVATVPRVLDQEPGQPEPLGAPGPGWYPDPGDRHDHRWWDGSDWSHHVSDKGTTSRDPLV